MAAVGRRPEAGTATMVGRRLVALAGAVGGSTAVGVVVVLVVVLVVVVLVGAARVPVMVLLMWVSQRTAKEIEGVKSQK